MHPAHCYGGKVGASCFPSCRKDDGQTAGTNFDAVTKEHFQYVYTHHTILAFQFHQGSHSHWLVILSFL
jgi:hypothetical protein